LYCRNIYNNLGGERERDYCSPVKYSLWLEPKCKRKRLTCDRGCSNSGLAIPMDSSQALYKVVQMKRVMGQVAAKKDGNFRRWNSVLELRVQRSASIWGSFMKNYGMLKR
jgi:hypothetical protein